MDADNQTKDAPSGDIASQKDGPSKGDGKPSPSTGESWNLTKGDLEYLGEEYARGKHSKLDTRIHDLTVENEALRQTSTEKQAQIDADAAKKLEAQERAELDAAEGNAEEQNRIRQRHTEARKHQELQAQSKELEGRIAANKDVLDRMTEQGLKNKANELAAEFPNVSADAILKLFKGETPEQMREVAVYLANLVPVTPKLPAPDSLATTPSGELTDEQKLKARYPSMHK